MKSQCLKKKTAHFEKKIRTLVKKLRTLVKKLNTKNSTPQHLNT